jgi:AcrR family transcriptional regulator
MTIAAAPQPSEAPALTRRERRKLEVRGRILEASRALFETQGIEATTVVGICERADVAEKTFFNHFSAKKQLLQSFAVDGLNQLLAWIESAGKGPGSFGAKLERFFTQLVDEVEHRGPMHRELLAEIVTVAHEARDESRQARLLHDAFLALVQDSLDRGDIDPRHDVETLTELLMGAYYTLTFNWAYLPDYPIRERALATARFLAEQAAPPEEADA